MERGRTLLVMTTVIAVMVLSGAVVLWHRQGLHGTLAAVRADAPRRAFSVAGSRALPAATTASAPVVGTDAAAESSAVSADGSFAGGNFAAGDADQRQLAKITRGMSAAAGGGVVVTATPPGSVTGQLHLHEGDVIVAVNGEAVSSPEEFARIYREQGLPRQLTILRDGREIHRH